MTHTCAYGSGSCCWVTCTIVFLAWLLGGSALLMLTWNKVIAEFAKVKQARYWQALLLLGTACVVFCAPRAYMMKHHYGGHGGHAMGCFHKKNCPHESAQKEDDDAREKEAAEKGAEKSE
ncbi:MAG: hypothetical protein HYW49_06685 [Deltaproteobacteria bacterium]|nr:hypothetical protein [Deltaproteobacteria bacterium]